jgi:hypothetical protein
LSLALLVFLVLTSLFSGLIQVKAEADQTPSQLIEADNALKKAFASVLEAEQAGANVTGLLDRLNDGADLLAQAEMAYRVGDVSGAVDEASGVFAIVSEVEADVVSAENAALINRYSNIWSVAAISDVAGFSFVLIMFLVWIWFKRSYIKRLSNSKPEVKGNEA